MVALLVVIFLSGGAADAQDTFKGEELVQSFKHERCSARKSLACVADFFQRKGVTEHRVSASSANTSVPIFQSSGFKDIWATDLKKNPNKIPAGAVVVMEKGRGCRNISSHGHVAIAGPAGFLLEPVDGGVRETSTAGLTRSGACVKAVMMHKNIEWQPEIATKRKKKVSAPAHPEEDDKPTME